MWGPNAFSLLCIASEANLVAASAASEHKRADYSAQEARFHKRFSPNIDSYPTMQTTVDSQNKATSLKQRAARKIGLRKEELKKVKIIDAYHLDRKQVVEFLEKKFPKHKKEIGEMQEINDKFYVMLPRGLEKGEEEEIAKLRKSTGGFQPDADGNLPFPFET
ncbi:uncharacterized protein PV09_05970 [Verruconis gallopava]|uniref:Nascent polypeptide-associated complex subunit beta n=1 Tax=Verruconis gallopava TaxID=253628 RepID=A0A0D2AUT9_9PEZI|nr:uncharacterized protein PV09_05970 [Verruconis gallopava]KIW02924.1 hypothetical protein PV09_05970 [Verruconis gallopava]